VVILDANDALLLLTTLVRVFIEVAAEALFVVTVPLNDVMEDFNEEEVSVKDELNVFISNAIDELKVVTVD
jgi:hypothetical protein